MNEIAINTWERKSHYEWFSSFANPCFSFDVRMDITNLLDFCKKENTPSFATILYLVCKCLNSCRAFRYRILDGKIFEIPYANAAYTVSVNDKYFVNNRTDMSTDYYDFCRLVKEQSEAIRSASYVQKQFNDTAIVDDIYCSCVPWIDFVSVFQSVPDSHPENSCIPRVCWGKYTEENGRTKMTMNITANHALVDGRDMSLAFMHLQKAFDNPENYLKGGTSQ